MKEDEMDDALSLTVLIFNTSLKYWIPAGRICLLRRSSVVIFCNKCERWNVSFVSMQIELKQKQKIYIYMYVGIF